MKSKLIILFIFFGLSYPSTGGITGSSYQYGTNARSISLSNALTANYNNGYNPLTNPALLGLVKKTEFGFSYFNLSLDRYIQSFSIVIPSPPIASIGISSHTLGTKNIPGMTSGNVSTGFYDAWEGYIMLSFGLNLGDFLSGINFKILKNQISSSSADGIGLDFGLLYSHLSNIKFGIMFENLYSKYSWDIQNGVDNISYDEDFPLIVKLGLASVFFKDCLILYQLDFLPDYDEILNKAGLELTFNNMKYRLGLNDKNNQLNYSIGFGTNIFKTKNDLNISMDYALDMGLVDEGTSHLFTFIFKK